jgi:hypothetical protein
MPQHDHRELEPLRLVHGEDLHGLGGDGVGRVNLGGVAHPGAQARGGGVVVEPVPRRGLREEEAQLAQAAEALGAVRAEGDGAGEGGALQEIARGGAGRAGEAPLSQIAHEGPRFPDARHARISGVAVAAVLRPHEIGQVHREERGAEERGLGDAVVAVGEGAEAQQELLVERILEEERAPARRPGDAGGVERGEEELQAPRGDGQDRDVPPADRARPAVEGIGDLHAARPREPAQVGRQGLALEAAVVVHVVLAAGEVEGQDVDGGAGCGVPAGDQRLVEDPSGREIERAPARVALEDALEAVVEPGDERGPAAEARGEAHGQVRLAGDDLAHAVVGGDVRPAEPVDGLLGIAHQGEAAGAERHLVPAPGAGLGLAQEQDDLGLERIRVLELVDEDVIEEALEVGAHRPVVPQEVAELHQEVELVEHLLPRLDALVEGGDDGEQARQARGEAPVEGAAEIVAQRPRALTVALAVPLPGAPRGVVAREGVALRGVGAAGLGLEVGPQATHDREGFGQVVEPAERRRHPLEPEGALGVAPHGRDEPRELPGRGPEGGGVEGGGLDSGGGTSRERMKPSTSPSRP